ncbi:restriction endonuclease subunit S, partial [Enterobacter cloacae]|nr:restriction endonuclease subunit S [Enterobacter cloacae]
MNNQNKLHGENVIPAGYKRTEVGVIPNDWVEIDLNSIVSGLEAGVSVNSIDQVDAYSHGKHILKTSCVSNGHFDGYEKKSILPTDVKRAKCSPVKGGIIVSRMNTPALVGEVGYVAESNLDSFLPDRLWQMKFKKDVAHNPKWLATLLSFPPFSKKIKDTATGTSGSMKNISKSAFLSLKLPWPTLKEQNIIGTVLSDADALITALEQLIAKKQAIKTATMQQLLTGRTRLPQFSKYHDGAIKDYKTSELGKIPKDWKITSIGDLFSISAGGDLRVDEFSDIKSELHPHPIYSNAISNFGLYGYCQSYDYIGEYLTITARGGIGHAVARKGSFCAIGRLLVLNPKGTSNVK